MNWVNRLRFWAFLVVLVGTIGSRGVGVLAYGTGALDSVISGNSYCSGGGSSDWTWSAECDFSEDPDPIGEADDFCNAFWSACFSECYSSAYVDDLAAECNGGWNPGPHCDDSCFITFASTNSCVSGSNVDASCECGAINWCLPG
jgi:hypothetical protein